MKIFKKIIQIISIIIIIFGVVIFGAGFFNRAETKTASAAELKSDVELLSGTVQPTINVDNNIFNIAYKNYNGVGAKLDSHRYFNQSYENFPKGDYTVEINNYIDYSSVNTDDFEVRFLILVTNGQGNYTENFLTSDSDSSILYVTFNVNDIQNQVSLQILLYPFPNSETPNVPETITYNFNAYFYAGEYVPGYGQGLAAGISQGVQQGYEEANAKRLISTANSSNTEGYVLPNQNAPETAYTQISYSGENDQTISVAGFPNQLVYPGIIWKLPQSIPSGTLISIDVDFSIGKLSSLNIAYKSGDSLTDLFVLTNSSGNRFIYTNQNITELIVYVKGAFTFEISDLSIYIIGEVGADIADEFYNNGYNEGYDQGYNEGYAAGDGGTASQGFLTSITLVMNSLFNNMTTLFSTEIAPGLNIGLFVIGIPASILILDLIVSFIIKIFKGKGT